MTIKAECTACGQDCTNANATYNGDIYHVGCLPRRPRRDNRTQSEIEYDMLDRRNWVAQTLAGK
jgi:hypothetical protein